MNKNLGIKKTGLLLYFSAILFLFVVLSTSTFAALFSQQKIKDFALSTGEIEVVSEHICNSAEIFQNPGDIHYESITISNTANSMPIKYFIEIDILSGNGLENAINVYYNDNIIGNLAMLCNEGAFRIDTFDTLYEGEEITVSLGLEYHIGASAYFSDKNFTISIKAYTKGLTHDDKITYVKNFYEISQVGAGSAFYGAYENSVIKLSNDIALTDNIVIDKNLTIDLNGHNLNLNEYNISFAGSGISYLKNSRNIGAVSGQGKIVLNASSGILINKTQTAESYFNIISYNQNLLLQKYLLYLNEVSANGVAASFDAYGAYGLYREDISLTFEQNLSVSSGMINIISEDQTTIKKIYVQIGTLNGEMEVAVIGTSSSSQVDFIIANNLGYLQNSPTIDYHLFLPLFIKKYNCHIEWYSTNPNIIDTNGMYIRPAFNATVTLVATIIVNDKVHTREFALQVFGKSNEEKLRDLINKYGPVYLTSIGMGIVLPSSSNYTTFTSEDLGIIAINYSYASEFTFLNLASNEISVMAYTIVKYVPLTITATFINGMVSDIIDVNINLVGGGNLEALFRYVNNDIFDYGGGIVDDIILPVVYEEVEITYIIPNDVVDNNPDEIISNVEIVNIIGVNNMVQIVNGTIQVNTDYLKTTPTLIYIIASANQAKRVFSFSLGGVLRNDQYGIANSNLFGIIRGLMGLPIERTYISLEEIEDYPIYSLSATSLSITSIKGLEYFSTLQNINLANNSISDISYLSNFSALQTLDLRNNNIASVAYLSKSVALNYLYLQGNSPLQSVEVIKNYSDLFYMDIDNTGCTFALNHWSFAYAYFQYKNKNGSNPNYWYTNTSNVRTRYAPSPNEKEQDAAYLLARIEGLDTLYDVLVLPASLSGANGFVWRVHSGIQNISITNNIATITRSTNDVNVVIILNVFTQGNSGFSVDRAFFITIKGTG